MKHSIIIFCFLFITTFFLYSDLSSCPKCNEDFRNELLKDRANTLGAKELLKTIENQTDSNQYVQTPTRYSNISNTQNVNNTAININDSSDNTLGFFDKMKFVFSAIFSIW